MIPFIKSTYSFGQPPAYVLFSIFFSLILMSDLSPSNSLQKYDE